MCQTRGRLHYHQGAYASFEIHIIKFEFHHKIKMFDCSIDVSSVRSDISMPRITGIYYKNGGTRYNANK